MTRNAAFLLAAALLILSAAAAAATAVAAPPTFNQDVAPILHARCATCHRAGEVAPFPLLTYRDARRRAGDLATVTGERLMPPWKPAPGHGEFLGDRRLTDAEVATIKAWADAGAPEGTGQAPRPPSFNDGWQLGKPDLVVKMPEPFTVPAEGRDVFRTFVLPLDLPADTFVRAVEFRPSNRRVVHHALFFLDRNGAARKLDAADPGPGYGRFGGGVGFNPTGGLGGWAPGFTPVVLPDGYGRSVRKGSDLVVQVHFSPTGKEEAEQSTVGLYFCKEPPAKVIRTFTVGSRRIDIPAGAADHKVTGSFTTPVAAEIVGITPHAHLVCREMKVWAIAPGGQRTDLLWIPDWDWNWQDQYLYKRPIHVAPGTRLEFEFTYDNSAANPRNPNTPPRRVRYGEQTADEMAFVFLQVVPDVPAAAAGGGGANQGGLRDLLRRLRGR